MSKFSFQGLRGPRSPGLAPMVSPCLPQHPRSTQGHRKQPPQEFTCKPGLRAASAIPLGGATGKGQLCRVAQVRTTNLPKGSRGPTPPFEKELGETPGCGWGGWGGAFQLPFLPPPPCPPHPVLLATFLPPPLPGSGGCVSFTLSPGRDTNPLAVSSPHCWDLLAISQRASINTKGEQKGSNYRKYKQHENSQVSKVQVFPASDNYPGAQDTGLPSPRPGQTPAPADVPLGSWVVRAQAKPLPTTAPQFPA